MTSKHHQNKCPTRTTTFNLEKHYQIFKKFITENPSYLAEFKNSNQPKKREERTKSKSSRKNNIKKSPTRQSGRINNTANGEQFLQIEKEPIFHQKLKKKELPNKKKPNHLQTKPFTGMPRIQSFQPHQHSYFQVMIEKTDKKFKVKSLSKNDLIPQYPVEIEKQKVVENQGAKQKELNDDAILNQLIDSDLDEKQIEDWLPSKLEGSLLAIQKLIDEYFIFNSNMRNRRLARVHQIVKYVREINGYFFSLETLQQLLSINPKLYKVISMERQKYVKCPMLDSGFVKRRLLSTKIKMKMSQN